MVNKIKKNGLSNHPTFKKQRGFSLLELLVASALGVVVIWAATESYMTTRTLNRTALDRVEVQQDIRLATSKISQDAQMAGSFGCANLSTNASNVVLSGGSDVLIFGVNQPDTTWTNIDIENSTNKGNYGAAILADSDVSIANFTPSSGQKALFFQYGIGSTLLKKNNSGTSVAFQANVAQPELLRSGGVFAVSSCKRIDIVKGTTAGITSSGSTITVTNLPIGVSASGSYDPSTAHSQTEIQLLRFVGHLYAVGEYAYSATNKKTGLYLFTLGDDGNWADPELVSEHINSLEATFSFAKDCNAELAKADLNKETFEFATDINNTDKLAPMSLVFNFGTKETKADNFDDTESTIADTKYQMTALIRGGNVCADRSVVTD